MSTLFFTLCVMVGKRGGCPQSVGALAPETWGHPPLPLSFRFSVIYLHKYVTLYSTFVPKNLHQRGLWCRFSLVFTGVSMAFAVERLLITPDSPIFQNISKKTEKKRKKRKKSSFFASQRAGSVKNAAGTKKQQLCCCFFACS